MRLLEFNCTGECILTKDLIDKDIHHTHPYAILSHTWGKDDEEVTFQDITNGTGASKPGYQKINFCGEQARRDGLKYCWVDTCCIDKSNNLTKKSLCQRIFEMTGIPVRALEGSALSNFSIAERFSWQDSRNTTKEEDKAYSLLGIFDVSMPLIYGEGRDNAFKRLQKEINAEESDEFRLLEKLERVDEAAYNSYRNQRHRKCVANTRVDILQQIAAWARERSGPSMFWLGSIAGTGKSTIAITAADALSSDKPLHQPVHILSFFFERGAGDAGRSRKFLSTLAYQLAMVSPQLRHHICKAIKLDEKLGRSSALSEQMNKLLVQPLREWRASCPNGSNVLLVVDALDECDEGADITTFIRLLGNIAELPDIGLRAFLTNRPEISTGHGFDDIANIHYEELALHNIPRQTADADINAFLLHELGRVKWQHKIPDAWPKEDQLETLIKKASELFIFAATV